MDVALIRWPAGETRRVELAGLHVARLLLVEPGAEPPVCSDALEDWVRLPNSSADTRARVRSLLARAEALGQARPELDDGGMLEYRSAQVHLSPLQAELIGPLIERFNAVIARDEIGRAAWPDGGPTDNTLDVSMTRLRRQVRLIGLSIRTVRSRGYMLCDPEADS